MKEYVLNKTPLRTTSNFKINDIKLELNIPDDYSFHNFEIEGETDKLILEENKNGRGLTSKIGLDFNNSYDINITVPKGTIIKNPIYLTYFFKENDNLIDNIKIIYEEYSEANFIIKYESLDNSINFHHLKEEVEARPNSTGKITVLNLLNDKSNNFFSTEVKEYENSSIKHNVIDLGGNTSIINLYGELLEYKAKHTLNSIYFGKEDKIIDINYHVKNIGKSTENYINVEGAIDDYVKKSFKGTIDFIEGSSSSIGEENENCILLSDTCISRSLPMLLCHEESVEGAHGVSSGKIDSSKLFYLMTRGFTKTEAEKILITANFNKIINEIESKKIEEELLEIVNKLF